MTAITKMSLNVLKRTRGFSMRCSQNSLKSCTTAIAKAEQKGVSAKKMESLKAFHQQAQHTYTFSRRTYLNVINALKSLSKP